MEQRNNIVQQLVRGKLYIAGEYAILENYSKSIITVVDKFIKITINKSEEMYLDSDFYGKADNIEKFPEINKFVNYILDVIEKDDKFYIKIESELIKDNIKFGLGSSAAVFVGIAKVIFKYYGLEFKKQKIFRIVALYNILNGKNGSMGDIAAIVYDGIIMYQKFNYESLLNQLKEKTIKDVVDSRWEGLLIEELDAKIKLNVKMNVQWTGDIVDTNNHINFIEDIRKDINYKKFVRESNFLVINLRKAMVNGNSDEFFEKINLIRKNLLTLEEYGLVMETDKMKEYLKGKIGKQSGSGGGDMIISFEKDTKFNIEINLNEL